MKDLRFSDNICVEGMTNFHAYMNNEDMLWLKNIIKGDTIFTPTFSHIHKDPKMECGYYCSFYKKNNEHIFSMLDLIINLGNTLKN